MRINRRYFLKQVGLGIAAAAISPYILSCQAGEATESPFKNIGIQLFTLRDLLDHDPRSVIRQVAKIGYKHVETYGVNVQDLTHWGLTLDELIKLLDDHGLKTYSGHYDLSKYLSKTSTEPEDLHRYVEVAEKLGQKYIVAPIPPMDNLPGLSPSDYQYFAEKLNEAGQITKAAGIKMAYHNHAWELRKFGNNTKGLDIMIAFTDPDLVDFELDIFWLAKAGENPLDYFERYPGRFPLWHVKDMDRNFVQPLDLDGEDMTNPDDKVRFAEVGSGNIDFVNIAAYQDKAGLKYAFVEQDQIYMDDKISSVRRSYDYIQRNLAK